MRRINFIFRLIAPLCIGMFSFACVGVSPATVEASPTTLSTDSLSDTNTPPAPLSGPGVETPATPTIPPEDIIGQIYQPANSGGGLITFIDENYFMAFDYPEDWIYEHRILNNYYRDIFTSPADNAKMENLVYNDGTTVTTSEYGQLALTLLHTIYSATGKEGDIKITDEAVMTDGSDRLTWESKGGGYSGVSYLELRGNDKKTFLMFTAWWNNDVDQDTLDVINNAISSYYIP